MNSFTSSSKEKSSKKSSRVRGALGVGLSLLLFFGVAEVGARKYARRHQNDLSDPTDYTSINARAAHLMKQSGSKIVFVGNSATQEGLDLAGFENAMDGISVAKANAPFHAQMCTAVDSQIKDWNWMLEHAYFGPKRRPDLFVVTYFSDNLQDVPIVQPGRFAQFFTSPRDWPIVFQNDITTLGERGDYVLSYFSLLYAMRVITQEKLLRASAPGYQKFATQLNDIQIQQTESALLPATSSPRSDKPALPYGALKRLLRRAQETGSKLCFVAYPRPGARYWYQLDPEAQQMIREAGMISLDLRVTPGLTPDKYRDSVHVNAQGRPIWTKAVASALAPVIASAKPASKK